MFAPADGLAFAKLYVSVHIEDMSLESANRAYEVMEGRDGPHQCRGGERLH